MGKALYIAEKPSVAQEFARALKLQAKRQDGYLEAGDAIVTWCVGHLVTMSYPESYDPALKKWSFSTLPFLPEKFLYEVIPGVAKQFKIVSGLLNRKDVETIYVCTDSGREGEYIYRLVEQESGVRGKKRKRVWIDSQTEEEILRGIREAKDLEAYDNLSESAYLRAKEDYLMGINFSRLLTLKYGNTLSELLNTKYTVISVGRVMTCVLGMVVRREREIREFTEVPFYRVFAGLGSETTFQAEWRVTESSAYHESPKLYKENGFRKKEDAQELIGLIRQMNPCMATIQKIEKKKEKKNAPLLFNLAEVQNTCAKRFRISPDETLRIIQELYEKKLVTYPRTDARVLSTAAAKEIHKNLNGLMKYSPAVPFLEEIVQSQSYRNLAKTRYVNDKQITDHYAIIPTGQNIGALQSLSHLSAEVYDLIVRRFLSVFFPPAVYEKISVEAKAQSESFFTSFKTMIDEGFLKVVRTGEQEKGEEQETQIVGKEALEWTSKVKKGDVLPIQELFVKEGKTSPPKRYNSGSLILAMENAGHLIEDEELRAQIKGSGIGTSATRGEILKKLFHIKYLDLNKKTQVVTPTLFGELIYDVVQNSIRSLLNPDLTASWEKGLTYVADGDITPQEYQEKLNQFIGSRTSTVKSLYNQNVIKACYQNVQPFYKKRKGKETGNESE